MKRTTAREAYNVYVSIKTRQVAEINKAKLNFPQRCYIEAKQQTTEQNAAAAEIKALRITR